jgi:hypothetical protein
MTVPFYHRKGNFPCRCWLISTATSPFTDSSILIYTMGKKRVLISYGVDVDAVAGSQALILGPK